MVVAAATLIVASVSSSRVVAKKKYKERRRRSALSTRAFFWSSKRSSSSSIRRRRRRSFSLEEAQKSADLFICARAAVSSRDRDIYICSREACTHRARRRARLRSRRTAVVVVTQSRDTITGWGGDGGRFFCPGRRRRRPRRRRERRRDGRQDVHRLVRSRRFRARDEFVASSSSTNPLPVNFSSRRSGAPRKKTQREN